MKMRPVVSLLDQDSFGDNCLFAGTGLFIYLFAIAISFINQYKCFAAAGILTLDLWHTAPTRGFRPPT